MHGGTFVALFLCSLLIAVGGDAQSPDTKEKPVWTLELIKVRPEQYALALGQLDDQWMRMREEAKREGAVVSYDGIQEYCPPTWKEKRSSLRYANICRATHHPECSSGNEKTSPKRMNTYSWMFRERATHSLSISPSSRKSENKSVGRIRHAGGLK